MKKSSIALLVLLGLSAFQAKADIYYTNANGGSTIVSFDRDHLFAKKLGNEKLFEDAKELIFNKLNVDPSSRKNLTLNFDGKEVNAATWGKIRGLIIERKPAHILVLAHEFKAGQKGSQY